jgi:hypothetical protein
LAEMNDGGYDMLVIGAPLPNGDGRDVLTGIAGEILGNVTQHPVLIIRSVYAQTDIPRLVLTERARNEEVVR